ncbi:hypothetical protein [Nocardia transvalensis]|uniref:hypothetical protein n=1 Tax=Nocardia transvalensis TaxID=37333 RepID=UPI001894DC12|nr:hypothetical protein [Nocardia transvalensis]MBF6333550.1 hypothetical protein [Nocardia transvalensis]
MNDAGQSEFGAGAGDRIAEYPFGAFAPGDEIAWWTDAHGRGVAPDHPEAVRRTGTIFQVHRSQSDASRVVAYSVERHSPLGAYLAIVRSDYHHRPTLTKRRQLSAIDNPENTGPGRCDITVNDGSPSRRQTNEH